MKVKVCVLQYDEPDKTDDSVVKLDELTGIAAKKGCQLIVAHETGIGEAAEVKETGRDYLPLLSKLAFRHKVHIATSFYRKYKGGMVNQGYIMGPDGKPALEHKKMYPAKPEVENLGVIAGKTLAIAQTKIGKLGMLICKDGFNRYSHFLYEKLGQLGVEIICIPSWSIGWKEVNTQEYVKGLYVYGAFASRAFVLMSDCINKSFNSYGRSLIVSPIRGVLKEGSVDREEMLIEELDLDEVAKARKFDSWWQPKKRII